MTAGRKLVIFDVDGTLIDSQNHIFAAMEHAFGAGTHPLPPREAVLSIVGLSLPEAVAKLVPEASQEEQAEIVAAYKQSYNGLRADQMAPFYPGAREALAMLRSRPEILMGVATGNSRRGLDHLIAAHDLSRHFATTQVADNHPSKPHPAMVLAALAETGIKARDAVMIGDTSFDMKMGRAAGVETIAVSWGYHRPEVLRAAGAGQVIDNFTALGPALDRIWGRV